MLHFRRSFTWVIAVAFVLVPVLGQAQSNVATGQLVGTVADQTGAPLPGATVTATNENTGFSRKTVSGTDGLYRLDFLPPGVYDLRVDMNGFKTEIKKGINVALGSVVKIDFKLQIAKVKEEIVVTAEAPVVDTSSANITARVNDRAIENLPLNGRDFLDFIALTPASVPDSVGRTHIQGAKGIHNSFNVDGANDQSSFFGEERGGTRPPFTFSQAAIKEFQVVSSEYSVQYNASGGIINAITKSGTNTFKGEAFVYYRPESFVGNYADGRDTANFVRRQFGGVFGGPIVKDKLHFFVSYDGQRLDQPTLRFFRRFPAGREADWEALTGLDYSKEVGSIKQTNDADAILLKLDWQLSDNHLLTFRDNYNYEKGENLTSNYDTTGWSNNGFERNFFNSAVVNLNSVLGDSTFNELIVQYAWEKRPREANVTSIPEVRIGSRYDATFGQNNFLPNFLNENRTQIVDNFTYYLGKHTLKAGINYNFVRFDDGFFRFGGGQYYYRSWDDFFNDNVYRYTQAFSDYNGAVKFNTKYWGGYIQDEWKVTPNLTLTYGLRYDLQDHDNPKETNPLFPQTGQIPNDTNNIAPRAGFAWDINGDGKQVLRGGVGLFYDNVPTLLDANAMLTNGVRVVRVELNCGTDPCPSWPNRIPSLGSLPTATPSIFVYDKNFENPETWRASLGYEAEVAPDMSVGVDLIYSSTRKLERKQDQNIVPDGGTTIDGRPTYKAWYFHSNYPDLGKILMFNSDAKANYKALILKVNKRYSNGWMLNASYTYSRSRDEDSNERSVSSSSSGLAEDQYNLGADWGPSNFDVKHRFVASATVQLPYDFTFSTIVTIRSGFPFTATDGRDLNKDGYFRDRATVELEPGVYKHYRRNTFRQPWFHNMDVRLTKTFRLGGDYQVQIIGEVFNLFDNENFFTTRTQLVDRHGNLRSDFNRKNRSGDPRQFQVAAKIRF